MRCIKKFEIQSMMNPVIEMPKGSKILKLANKKIKPYIWAEIDTSRCLVKRLIKTYKTEEEMPDEPGLYLGTVELLGYTFHCYDGGERI